MDSAASGAVVAASSASQMLLLFLSGQQPLSVWMYGLLQPGVVHPAKNIMDKNAKIILCSIAHAP